MKARRSSCCNCRPTSRRLRVLRLDPSTGDQAPVHTVHAGNWQAARTTGAYTLVGCTVGPGFDFQDFTMLSDASGDALKARTAWPEVAGLL